MSEQEQVIKLGSFENRRFEPAVWNGGTGTGDENPNITSTGFKSPRAPKESKSQPKTQLSGTVEKFNGNYGFVSSDDRKHRLFFHWSSIVANGDYKTTVDGQRVVFDIGEKDGKPVAINVREV